ncbi:hypothetical protein Glove_137g86 [Diversispora epigaea]|uniref:Uncharacterized protein n=1 Tax=Diversispora epigaea TaxID=1348612 RepID=A0A397J0P8_9GLOM|nr:hypothetical protein Glove_137g86 [Diversispora epigaea]
MSDIEIHEASTGKDNKGKDKEGKDVGIEKIEEEPIELIEEEVVGEKTVDILTPELKEVYKKLDRRMRERYDKSKTDEGKINILETTIHERKRGVIFIAISALSTIAITVTAIYIKDENSTKIFIITLNCIIFGAQTFILPLKLTREAFVNKSHVNLIIIVLSPTCIGIILAIFLGIFAISPTLAISWIGVGASISNHCFEIANEMFY